MSLDTISVSSVMNPNVVTATEDQNIMSACRKMYENHVGCLIIIKLTGNRIPLGIITERDVVLIISKLSPTIFQTPLRTLIC